MIVVAGISMLGGLSAVIAIMRMVVTVRAHLENMTSTHSRHRPPSVHTNSILGYTNIASGTYVALENEVLSFAVRHDSFSAWTPVTF